MGSCRAGAGPADRRLCRAQGSDRSSRHRPANAYGQAIATAPQARRRRRRQAPARSHARSRPLRGKCASLGTSSPGRASTPVIAEGGTACVAAWPAQHRPHPAELGSALWHDPALAGPAQPAGRLVPGAAARTLGAIRRPLPGKPTAARRCSARDSATTPWRWRPRWRSAAGPCTDETLTQPTGFSGVDGIFRFRPDGRVEHGLAVLGVERDAFTIVDPAPQAFQPLTN